MDDLLDDEGGGPGTGSNAPEMSVSELSGSIRRTLEGAFGRVRVRAEVGRVFRARSGHLYFDLKDDRAVLACVCWKGQIARLSVPPEEGLEVVATGRLTTFGGQSKYQLTVEDVALAGQGALMAMLEKRRVALAAEGLFDEARKRPLPYLPEVIGVVTSPQGAVIRDILHRLRERFPRRVIVWPVAVQGRACAPEVAAAIEGFDALPPGGAVPRPDLLIVARGGGSIEDLWGFNEEAPVRAAAACRIPLISAVGHETDTTLLDFAADRRAPTPTAAAEMAVPVRLELLAAVEALALRQGRAARSTVARRRQRLGDVSRALPRPDLLLAGPAQRLDRAGERLPAALRARLGLARVRLSRLEGRGGAAALSALARREEARLEALVRRLGATLRAGGRDRQQALDRAGGALRRRALRGFPRRRERTERLGARLDAVRARPRLLARRRLEAVGPRLRIGALRREAGAARSALGAASTALGAAWTVRLGTGRARLGELDRLLRSLGYDQTLRRGYAVVRAAPPGSGPAEAGAVVTSVGAASEAGTLEIEFADGRIGAGVGPDGAPPQGPGRSGGRARRAAPPAAGEGRQGKLL
jgi:exodeoxyribonuclease VII large subunit